MLDELDDVVWVLLSDNLPIPVIDINTEVSLSSLNSTCSYGDQEAHILSHLVSVEIPDEILN